MKIRVVYLLFLLSSCASKRDTEQAFATSKNFLQWYKDHYSEVNGFQLVNQSGDLYRVNFDETEKFIASLESSELVSKGFLESWKGYFTKADQDFVKDSVNEGPPPGFDYDLILKTQEPYWILEDVNKLSIETAKVEENKITISFDEGIIFQLIREEEKWKVDAINFPPSKYKTSP